jgi:hypothetical protein
LAGVKLAGEAIFIQKGNSGNEEIKKFKQAEGRMG